MIKYLSPPKKLDFEILLRNEFEAVHIYSNISVLTISLTLNFRRRKSFSEELHGGPRTLCFQVCMHGSI